MDIVVASEATMSASLPAAGNVTLFINTDKNNVLYYINSAGEFYPYNTGDTSLLEECCSCIIAKQWMDRVTCALNSGMLTATEFGTIVNAGLSVVATETADPVTGTKTCRVDIGPRASVYLPESITAEATEMESPDLIKALVVAGTTQLTHVILPASASQAVTYTTSNALVATVSASGLITAVGAGICFITIKSVANPALSVVLVCSVNA